MLREFVISIFGWRVVDGFFSTSMLSMPNDASVLANVIPTGPPPAIRTGTSFMGFLRIPDEAPVPDVGPPFAFQPS
jgi:hypothetical protein